MCFVKLSLPLMFLLILSMASKDIWIYHFSLFICEFLPFMI